MTPQTPTRPGHNVPRSSFEAVVDGRGGWKMAARRYAVAIHANKAKSAELGARVRKHANTDVAPGDVKPANH